MKYGATLTTVKRLGININQDGSVNTRVINYIAKAKAVDNYCEHYFLKARLKQFPEMLQQNSFDM